MLLGLDLGVVTGFAFGDGDRAPIISSWDLRDPVRGRRALFLAQNLFKLIRDVEVDVIYIEAPPNLKGMTDRGTNIETLRSLYGYAMIVDLAAAKTGVRLGEVDVQIARRDLLGFQPPRGQGKKLVSARCKQLRWRVENFNESDAAAVWSYGVGVEQAEKAIRRRVAEPARQR